MNPRTNGMSPGFLSPGTPDQFPGGAREGGLPFAGCFQAVLMLMFMFSGCFHGSTCKPMRSGVAPTRVPEKARFGPAGNTWLVCCGRHASLQTQISHSTFAFYTDP